MGCGPSVQFHARLTARPRHPGTSVSRGPEQLRRHRRRQHPSLLPPLPAVAALPAPRGVASPPQQLPWRRRHVDVPSASAAAAAGQEGAQHVARENPRLIQFHINHNSNVFRVHARSFARFHCFSGFFASMRVLSHEFNSRCIHSRPCIRARTFVFRASAVRRSDLRVSCVAVRARARGAVCRLTAVPASEAAHARPAELLVRVAVLLALLVPA